MALLDEVLTLIPGLSSQVENVFSDFSVLNEDFGNRFREHDYVLPVRPAPPPGSLCAVDGARVQEKMYAADLLIAVAVSANGKSGLRDLPTPSKAWGQILENDAGNSRVNAAAMASLEANLLADMPHQVRILDGSFITPLLGISEGVQSKNRRNRKVVYDLLSNPQTDPAEALAHIYSHTADRPIIAIPKSDTSSHYVEHVNKTFHIHIKLRDRFFATQTLEAGEYLKPLPLFSYMNYTVPSHQDSLVKEKKILSTIQKSVDILAGRSSRNEMFFTYVKPTNSTTVIRFEFLCEKGEEEATASRLAALIDGETHAPHMLEPYAQVVVDKQAKAISPATQTVKNMIVSNLTEDEKRQYGHLLLRDYRT